MVLTLAMDKSAEKFEFEEPVTAAQASGLHKRSLLYKVVKTIALVLIWICIVSVVLDIVNSLLY